MNEWRMCLQDNAFWSCNFVIVHPSVRLLQDTMIIFLPIGSPSSRRTGSCSTSCVSVWMLKRHEHHSILQPVFFSSFVGQRLFARSDFLPSFFRVRMTSWPFVLWYAFDHYDLRLIIMIWPLDPMTQMPSTDALNKLTVVPTLKNAASWRSITMSESNLNPKANNEKKR